MTFVEMFRRVKRCYACGIVTPDPRLRGDGTYVCSDVVACTMRLADNAAHGGVMLDIEAIKARNEKRKKDATFMDELGWGAIPASLKNERLNRRTVDDIDALIAAHGMCPGCGHSLTGDEPAESCHSGDRDGDIYCGEKGCGCSNFRL